MMDSQNESTSWETHEPPIPRPFEPSPRPLVPEGQLGCGRAALVGCGLLLLIFAVAALILVTRADDMALWLMEKLRAQVMTSLADEVPEDERASLNKAFEAFGQALPEGRIDPEALPGLQTLLLELAQKTVDDKVSAEEARRLQEALERAVLPHMEGPVAALGEGLPA